MGIFEEVALQDFLGRLVSVMESEFFYRYLVDALARKAGTAIADPIGLAIELVSRAKNLGFRSDGDVMPYCLLSLTEGFRSEVDGMSHWILAILDDVKFDPMKRMDAVYALLNREHRKYIFES